MNNTSLSEGELSFGWSPVFLITCLVLYSLIIVISILGNILVCVAICLNDSLRSSPTMSFIFSLACSDLLISCLAMPFDAESLLLKGQWKHGETLCIVWTTAYLFSVPTSMLTLVALTIDRYKALSDPLRRFRKTKFFSMRCSRIIVVFLWLYNLAFSLIPVMGWRNFPRYVLDGHCYFNITPSYSALSSMLHFILPLLIIGGIYFKIYRISQNVKRCQDLSKVATSSPADIVCYPTPRDHGRFQRNMKATKTIALIISVLFVCWFPHSIASLTFSLCKECYLHSPPEVLTSLLILGYLNSALNPFIYSLQNRKFRATYHALYLSVRKVGRAASQRSRLSSISSQRSSICFTFHNKGRQESVVEQNSSVRMTAYSHSLKSL
ncbi:histamine H2 receptor-like [Montipora capricornis]|uniref:histamine H2 receptor-like n=1 Tax=Montipora capricornis TaxID=246305 RepID=UPI0035F127D9